MFISEFLWFFSSGYNTNEILALSVFHNQFLVFFNKKSPQHGAGKTSITLSVMNVGKGRTEY
ncbi:hypothetical protein BM523_17930 [Alteromonas mediterranea]|nr:hypothetical protein BM523_17930 [Alteromonas mediterranea]APD99357.1 hypothetical protein BM525_17955 [Alteromonas mediterranea]